MGAIRWYVWAGVLLLLVLTTGMGNVVPYLAAYALEFLLLAVGCRAVWRWLHRGRAPAPPRNTTGWR
jgi:hypothetical protein